MNWAIESRTGVYTLKNLPSNNAASCGIIASRRRRSIRPIVLVSSPSMLMCPSSASIMRNKESVNELFPAPVRPTTPIFSCGLISRVMFFKTKSSPGRYRAEKFSNETAPWEGQLIGGRFFDTISGASLGKAAYSKTLSTLTMFVSAQISATSRNINSKTELLAS